MTPAEEALLVAAIQAAPGIGQFIASVFNREPETAQTKRVREILPERSASQIVAEELARAAQGG